MRLEAIIQRVKFWLITKIAGSSPVILNCTVGKIDEHGRLCGLTCVGPVLVANVTFCDTMQVGISLVK